MEAYEGREPYIFISYARVDADKVTPLLEALSSAGYRIWYDAGIQSGADWLEVLLGKVAACEVFCPLFSEAFKDSHYCYEETEWAYQKRKTIVPVYLEELTPDGLRLFYQRLLQSRQTLRLYDCADAAEFVERLGREQAFASCKAPEWHKVGEIQWRFSESDGVLTIAKNEDLPYYYECGSISPYQYDPIHDCSTAPWRIYRNKILSVEIADDIDVIGENAFCDCVSLMNVHIPDSVTTIGNGAFAECHKLTNVHIPDSVTIIGNSAFANCSSLIDANISNNVTKIGDFAFFACYSLTNVRIPDGVTTIGNGTFLYCDNLTNVRIPDGVTTIGDSAFDSCEGLMNVRIPDGVTQIGENAFFACISLMSVRIPDSVTQIGDRAFVYCKNLKSVEIPVGAKVGRNAFPSHTLVTRRDAPEQSQ